MHFMVQDSAPDIASSTEGYAGRFAGPVGQYLLRVQEQAIIEMLERAPKKGRVLDVGGGHCQLTQLLLDRGYEVVLHGSSEQSFARANKLGLLQHPRLSTVISPLEQLPFEDREFDIVVAIRMLAHIDEWERFLSELGRVARTEVIVDFASLYTLNIFTPILFRLKKRIEKNTRSYLCQSATEVGNTLKQAGFNRLYSRAQFFLPMGLHRALKNVPLSEKLERLSESAGATRLLGSPVIVGAVREV